METKNYSEDSIQVLTAAEHVQKRPGMYIGDLKEYGVTNLLMKTMLQLLVTYRPKRLCVERFGEGRYRFSIGGNVNVADDFSGSVAKISDRSTGLRDGLNWIGILNALSSRLQVLYSKQEKQIIAEYAYGKQQSVGTVPCRIDAYDLVLDFTLNKEILPVRDLNFIMLQLLAMEKCCLLDKMELKLKDHQAEQYVQLQIKDGLKQLADVMKILGDNYFYSEKTEIEMHIAENKINIDLFFVPGGSGTFSYVNGERTQFDGSHVQGVHDGFRRASREWAKQKGLKQTGGRKAWRSKIVISVWMNEPCFSGATKSKLDVPEVQKLICENVKSKLLELAETDEAVAKFLC